MSITTIRTKAVFSNKTANKKLFYIRVSKRLRDQALDEVIALMKAVLPENKQPKTQEGMRLLAELSLRKFQEQEDCKLLYGESQSQPTGLL